jgi:hypothetical protein
MEKFLNSLKNILEEANKLEKKYSFEEEFKKKNNGSDNTEPQSTKMEDNPIMRMLKDIENGSGSLEELKKLIKEHDKKSKYNENKSKS